MQPKARKRRRLDAFRADFFDFTAHLTHRLPICVQFFCASAVYMKGGGEEP